MSTHIVKRVGWSQASTLVTLTIDCGSPGAALELHRSIARDVSKGDLRLTLLNGEPHTPAPAPHPEAETAT